VHNVALNFHDEMSFFGDVEEHSGTIQIDRVLRSYFPNYDYHGVFFDVGAFDPITISNSHHFHQKGWTVYAFEANPHRIPLIKQHRQYVYNYAIADTDLDAVTFHNVAPSHSPAWTAGYSAINISEKYKEIFGWNDQFIVEKVTVPQRTLKTVIETEIKSLQKIDIMSLDIEGGELAALKGLDLTKYPPSLITVENPDDDPDLKSYLLNVGYRLDHFTSRNQYYVHSSFVKEGPPFPPGGCTYPHTPLTSSYDDCITPYE